MKLSRIAPVLAALAALAAYKPTAAYAAPQQDGGPAGGSTAVANGDEISLAVGETRTIPARDVKNFSDGNNGVIETRLTTDNNQFVIHGRKPGSTTMLLIKNDGSQVSLTINVFARPPQVVEKELTQLLDGLPNVHVRRVGARFVLDGSVANDGEVKRVQHVASLYPGQVEALVTIGGAGGSSDAATYIVRIDFYFVQYDKNSSYGVGLGWPGSIGGQAVVQNSVTFDLVSGAKTATATITNQPIPRLDIAATNGWAKVLKQATVITNNGVEASFSNGGEQNFTANTGLTVGIQKIPFGTDVTVLPHYNPQRREIEMKLVADVSDLTAAVSANALPGRTTSKLTTNITLKLGQSIVLSGIHTQSQTHDVTGLPLLSQIPVLGLLFGSHANQTLETEGAVFVIPNVVEAAPTSATDMVNTAVSRFADYSGDMDKAKAYNRAPGARPEVVK